MKAHTLLVTAFVARSLAQQTTGSQSKADPPNHYEPGPRELIEL